MGEYIIGNIAAQLHTIALIEDPMDAKVQAAHAVLAWGCAMVGFPRVRVGVVGGATSTGGAL